MRCVDGAIHVGVGAGIRIGNRDTPDLCPARDMRTLCGTVIRRIDQLVVLIGVAVWPAIDRDCCNVALDIETAAAQRAVELSHDLRFEIIKGHLVNALLTDAILLALIQSLVRRGRHEGSVQHRRLIRR